MTRKIKDTKFDIYGHDQTRAFCFIDDAVRGTVGAMESDKSVSQIYHIGNDEEISMAELTKYIGNLLDYNGEYEKANTYPGSVNRRCPNIEKARTDFGYTPELNWKLAVENYLESYHLPWIHPGLNSYSKLEDHENIVEYGHYAGQISNKYVPRYSTGKNFNEFRETWMLYLFFYSFC